MPDGMTFSENIQNEKRKWKNMNGKQRWDYFKTYYMLPTVIILFVLIAVISFIFQAFVFRKVVILSGFIYNQYIDNMDMEALQDDLFSYLDGDSKEEELTISSYALSDSDRNSQLVLTANVSAGSVDFVILDQVAYDIVTIQGLVGPVDEYMTAEDYEKYKAAGKIVTAVEYETQEEFEAGVDISETKLAQKYWPGQKVYLCYIINSSKTEELEKLLTYLDK